VRIGAIEVLAVDDGRFWLDGGSMFGVVPQALWKKSNPPDEEGRIELALRCLLLRAEGRVLLVDTGIGDHWPAEEAARFRIDRGPGLLGALAQQGLGPDDVTDVILTHLHFDHAGGAVQKGPSGLVPTFKKARHHLQRRNFAHGQRPFARDKASYLARLITPLIGGVEWTLYDGPAQILPGLDVLPFEGHTPGQQLIRVRDPQQRTGWLLYGADIVPTSSHLSPPFVMGYDLQPDVTAKEKARLIHRAIEDHGILVFEHDPKIDAASVTRDEKGRPVVERVISLRAPTH
jgi:glyoxylase-like metal-dependent hydrolase (beta-lactamase superfamily II)